MNNCSASLFILLHMNTIQADTRNNMYHQEQSAGEICDSLLEPSCLLLFFSFFHSFVSALNTSAQVRDETNKKRNEKDERRDDALIMLCLSLHHDHWPSWHNDLRLAFNTLVCEKNKSVIHHNHGNTHVHTDTQDT